MDLKEKLKEESGPATWDDLKVFVQRGTLIFLDNDLDLIEIGLKVANDNSVSIKNLIDSQKLIKAYPEMFNELKDNKFQCLIVEPFVLFKVSTD